MTQLGPSKIAQEDWLPVLSESLQTFLAEADDRAALLKCIALEVGRVGDVECEIGFWAAGQPGGRLISAGEDTAGPRHLLEQPLLREAPGVLTALSAGPALLFPSPETEPLANGGFDPTSSGLACLAYVPMRTPARNWGAMAVARPTGSDVISALDLRLLQCMADRAAIALEHGYVLAEARKELAERQRMTERLRVLAQASRDFAAATSDYRRLLDLVARTVGQFLGDLCSIRLISRDGRWLNVDDASVFHPDPEVAEAFRSTMRASPQRADEGLAGEVVASGQPLLKAFSAQDELESSTLPNYLPLLQRVDIGSLMLLPLMSHERCLGVLSLSRTSAKPAFDADDLQLARDFADRASLAIENATLLGDLRARVAEVEAAEDRFRRLLESAPDALVLVDDHGRLALVNTQTERLFGYARNELLGQRVELLVSPSSQDVVSRFRRSAVPATGITGLELLAQRKDGSLFPAEINLSQIETRDGQFVTALVRDASERKRLDEARARTLQLEDDNRRAHEASRLKSEFLANMSHELRTPLNAIIGFSALMHAGKAGPLSESQTEYLGDILTSSRHLLQLINDVLDLAKIEAGRMDVRAEPVDLLRVASEVRDILRGFALEKDVSVTLHVAPELANVVTDPRLLKQILYNYLSNAIKFTPELGAVRVVFEPAGAERFALKVLDTGIGIRQQDLHRLFKEFEQLPGDGTKKYPGTGLGLALSRRLVEAQGGSVSVSSVLGEGSEFRAELPLRPRLQARTP